MTLRKRFAAYSLFELLFTCIQALGDKLNILDADGDGELSSDELKAAIKILRRVHTEAEAEEIIKVLDPDRDGRVSVVELLQYVESRKKKLEVEVLEVGLRHS